MNANARSSSRSGVLGRVPFSALILLFFASAVVLISVMIMFTYVTAIFDRQSGLEESLQAFLTEESAVELLAGDLTGGSISDFSILPSYSIDEQTTTFQMVRISSAPPEELMWRVAGDSVLTVLPVGHRLVAVSSRGGDIIVEAFNVTGRGRPVRLADLQGREGSIVASAAVPAENGADIFMVFNVRGELEVLHIPAEGEYAAYPVDPAFRAPVIMASAGHMGGDPVLLLSGGGTEGLVFYPSSGISRPVFSPAGTTPVIIGGGRLFGDVDAVNADDSGPEIFDVLHGDFTGDGREDLVFAGPHIVSIIPGDGSGLISDTVSGGGLAAWGTAESRGLLSARWVVNGSQDRWRVYLNGAFTDSPGPEFLPVPWEGRISYSRHSMLGGVSDSLVHANENAGSPVAVAPRESSMICDLEGIGYDVVDVSGSLIRVMLNPLEGNGLHLTLRSVTRGAGSDPLLVSTWDLDIYGAGPSKRIRWERAV